jgi:hypothetical protein
MQRLSKQGVNPTRNYEMVKKEDIADLGEMASLLKEEDGIYQEEINQTNAGIKTKSMIIELN